MAQRAGRAERSGFAAEDQAGGFRQKRRTVAHGVFQLIGKTAGEHNKLLDAEALQFAHEPVQQRPSGNVKHRPRRAAGAYGALRERNGSRRLLRCLLCDLHGWRWLPHIEEARKHFFFEKKKQKTFVPLIDASDNAGAYLIE